MPEDDRQPDKKTGFDLGQVVATSKDLLSFLRDLVFVLLFLLLILSPEFMGDRLSRAGFEEGSVMGFKWRKKAETFGDATRKLQQSLDDARRQILAQTKVIEDNQKVIAGLSAQAPDKAAIASITKSNEQTLARSRAVSAAAEATIRAAAPAVEQAQDLAGDAKWAVIMGGDPQRDSAQYEVDLARRRGVASAQLYFRQNYYRTVAIAGDRKNADAILQIARQRQKSAYVVDMRTWCPKSSQADGVTICQ